MDPISIALGLSQFVPGIVRWIAGDDAGKVAEDVVGIAKAVSGQDDGDKALKAIQKNPELALQFQRDMQSFELGKYQEETKRLEAINATMRKEYSSNDPYVRRMRPTFGYIMAATWLAQMMAVAYVIAFDTENVGKVLVGISQLSTIWTVGLAVLGIYVYRRSSEKMGDEPTGPLGTINKLLGRG